MPTPPFSTPFVVRDYELDMQGVVNNSVYQNYLEHARHLFLKHHGIDFAQLTLAGIHLVVTRIELDYLQPLRSGDEFTVTVRMERSSRLRFTFYQEIIRTWDGATMLRAQVTGTGLNAAGRPRLTPELEALLTDCVERPLPGTDLT